MPIWKLTPMNPTDPNWRRSAHCEAAIIRAPSERIARSVAVIAFSIAAQMIPGEPMFYCPWPDRELVQAEQIDDPRWVEDGDVEILDPPHHNDEIAAVHWE